MKLIKYTILSLLLLTSYVLSLKSVAAQTVAKESIRVTPIINDLKLTPGKTTSFTLTIENISGNPVGINTEITGFDVLGETPLTDQKPSAMTNWTNLNNNNLLLGAHQKKTITVEIITPSNAEKNGYYETIFLTPIFNQEMQQNSPIILSRVGVLVLGTVGNLNYDLLSKKVSVTDISPSKTIVNNFPQTISFTVANKYFSHFDAKPFITITPLFANSQTVLLSDKHVLPGSVRVWQYVPTVPKNHVFYQVHLAVSVGDGKQIFADTWFVVLPYQPVLLCIAILALLLFIYIRRKQWKKFATILLRG